MNYSNTWFLSILMLSTIIIISSSSWVLIWLGLEVNLMMFMPLIMSNQIKESSFQIKYFIIQSLSSVIILLSLLLNKETLMSHMMPHSLTLLMGLSIKLGLAPLHFWLMLITPVLNPTILWWMLGWQKIGPLFILLSMNNMMMVFIMIMTAIVGALGGLNSNNMLLLLTYSSMVHMSWMMLATFKSEKIMMMYLMGYLLINWTMMNMMKETGSHKTSFLSFTAPQYKYTLVGMMMVFGGMPPFLGFSLKIMIILNMMFTQFFLFILSIILLCSLVSLFYYMNLVSVMVLGSSFKMKKSFLKPKKLMWIWMCLFFSVILLDLMT